MPAEKSLIPVGGRLSAMLKSAPRAPRQGSRRHSRRGAKIPDVAPRSGTAPAALSQLLGSDGSERAPLHAPECQEADFVDDLVQHCLVFQAREDCISAVRLDPCSLQDELMRFAARVASAAWQLSVQQVRTREQILLTNRAERAEEETRVVRRKLLEDVTALQLRLDETQRRHEDTLAELSACEQDLRGAATLPSRALSREGRDYDEPRSPASPASTGSAASPSGRWRAIDLKAVEKALLGNALPGIFKRRSKRVSVAPPASPSTGTSPCHSRVLRRQELGAPILTFRLGNVMPRA